jgi:hypothetical protein
MKNKKIILFIFCFNLISQEHYNFYDAITRGTSKENFRKLLVKFPDDELIVQTAGTNKYNSDYIFTRFLFNRTELFERGDIPFQCRYKFNICEFLASRFAGDYDKLKEMLEVVLQEKPDLLKKNGIIERLLCPWYPHQILNVTPNYKCVDLLLHHNMNVNTEELGATPLHFLLDFKANNPNFSDNEFKIIFLLLKAKNARRKILTSSNMMIDLLQIDEGDPQMKKISLDNPELAKWIINKYQ